MSDFALTAGFVILYRALTVVCGVLCIYFGYRLFAIGVYEKATDLKAAWGDRNLAVKQAAPGTFFALFGAAIIIVCLWSGVSFDQQGGQGGRSVSIHSTTSETDQLKAQLDFALEVQPILDKLLAGVDLDETDRERLKVWLSNNRISIHANNNAKPQLPAGVRGPDSRSAAG